MRRCSSNGLTAMLSCLGMAAALSCRPARAAAAFSSQMWCFLGTRCRASEHTCRRPCLYCLACFLGYPQVEILCTAKGVERCGCILASLFCNLRARSECHLPHVCQKPADALFVQTTRTIC